MRSLKEVEQEIQQAALEKRWLNQRVQFPWLDGTVHIGRVALLNAKNKQAYVIGDDGKNWHQPVEELREVEREPEPKQDWTWRWARWITQPRRTHPKETA